MIFYRLMSSGAETTTDGERLHIRQAVPITDKQRHGEREGNVALWFDLKSRQFIPKANAGAMPRPTPGTQYRPLSEGARALQGSSKQAVIDSVFRRLRLFAPNSTPGDAGCFSESQPQGCGNEGSEAGETDANASNSRNPCLTTRAVRWSI